MKKVTLAVCCAAIAGGAFAGDDVAVRGYVKRDGTYVAPHMQTAPDATVLNNYSTKDNTNPYTGQAGTVDPYRVQPKPTYEPRTSSVEPTKPIKY